MGCESRGKEELEAERWAPSSRTLSLYVMEKAPERRGRVCGIWDVSAEDSVCIIGVPSNL